jgi:hypothetical protein
MAKYSMETPAAFVDQLKVVKFDVQLFELPARSATNILTPGSKYLCEVQVELGAKIKPLLAGEWCVSLLAESVGPGEDKRMSKVIPMDNCSCDPDKVSFEISESWLDGNCGPDGCGDVYSLACTVVARDRCNHRPIGIAGFAKLGDVMTYA